VSDRRSATQQASPTWRLGQSQPGAPMPVGDLFPAAQTFTPGGATITRKKNDAREPAQRAAGKAHKRVVHVGRGEALLEHFRHIYLSIQPFDNPGVPPSIGVTSAANGDGRTTVATGIASAMAADLDVPVVLVEVDLARPGVHRVMGIAPEPGISEYLRGECDIGTAVRQIAERLFVLPAGNAHGEAPRLIRQLSTADLRQRLDSSGAVLVFDLPPILDLSYGVLASTLAESLVFVVRSGVTTSGQIKEALGRLDESVVRGIALNGTTPVLPRWLRAR
jgi:Mrp family chromosome partitioning ATPase